jgi:hypothetical protein
MKLRAIPAVLLCLASVAPLPLRAEEPRKPEAAVSYFELSVASLNALTGQLKALDIPLPEFLSTAFINKQFVFLGGIDETAPGGVTFLLSKDEEEEGPVYFSLPAKDPAAFEKLLVLQGEKPAIEGEKIYNAEGSPMRFTPNRVLFGGTPEILKTADPNAVAKPYADGNKIASLTFDAAALRRTRPDYIKTFFDELIKEQPVDPAATEEERRLEEIGQKFIVRYISDVLERVDVSVLKSTEGVVGLHVELMPGAAWKSAPQAFPMPALPESAARLDVAATVPNVDFTSDLASRVLKQLTNFPQGSFMPFICQFSSSHLSGDALSIAAASTDGEPVVYAVRQAAAEQDLEDALKKFETLCDKFDKDKGTGKSTKLDSYTTKAGDKVVRETLVIGPGSNAFVDFLKKDKRIYMAFSTSDKKFIENIALNVDLPEKTIKKGFALQVDIAQGAKILSGIPGADVPPEVVAMLSAIKKPLALSCEPTEKSLMFSLTLPGALLKPIVESLSAPDEEPKGDDDL